MACCGQTDKALGTEADPIVLGAADGCPPVLVHSNVNLQGLRYNVDAWVTGELVADMVRGGWLTEL